MKTQLESFFHDNVPRDKSPCCEDDITVWQLVSVHAAVQSDEVPLALHQHDQVSCAHRGALNIAHRSEKYAHRHRF